jgi:hypothetical protein
MRQIEKVTSLWLLKTPKALENVAIYDGPP